MQSVVYFGGGIILKNPQDRRAKRTAMQIKEAMFSFMQKKAIDFTLNPKKELVVAISGYFKPTVFDRIDFIKVQIEAKVETFKK